MISDPRLDPELAEFAADIGARDPIAVEGGGSRWHLGGVLAERARLISAPTGIVKYRPEEMVVTVRAGTTVADLHAHLAAHGQRSALPDRGGTVGGAVMVGENRFDALGRGLVRDAVLQVRYVSAEGEIISAGGPVVKNVSGFNLPKLLVGSLGTLGLLAEVTLRTNPTPPAHRWLRSDVVAPQTIRETLLRPAAILWNGTSTWVLLEGYLADIDAESIALDGCGSFTEVEGPPPLPLYRWSVNPEQLADLDRDRTGEFISVIGLGILHSSTVQPAAAVDPVVAQISARLKKLFDPTGRLNPGRTVGH